MTTPTLASPSATFACSGSARAVAASVPVRARASGKAVPLVLSVLVHALAALAAVHGTHPRPTQPRLATHDTVIELELATPDFELTRFTAEPPVQFTPATTPAPQRAMPSTTRELPARSASLPDASSASETAAAVAPSASSSALDAAAAAPRFVLALTPPTRASRAPAAGDAQARLAVVSSTTEPVSEASVDSRATLLAGASVGYTPEAEAAGVEASVPLEIVVDALGMVVGARALARVGYGLEQAAVRGVRAFRFSPARRAGKALAVRMRWVMRFQLR